MADTTRAWDADFWDRWWAEDFSWDGLAEKDWLGWSVTPDGTLVAEVDAPDGSRQATLQDYWGQWVNPNEAGGLIEIPDRNGNLKKFTKFHLPYVDGAGNETPKATWDDDQTGGFSQALQSTLIAATESDFDQIGMMIRDCRAQWVGIVAPRVPPGPAPHPGRRSRADPCERCRRSYHTRHRVAETGIRS